MVSGLLFVTDRTAKPPYVSNYQVMQEEMTVRSVMTANRDKRVWALAQGKDAAQAEFFEARIRPLVGQPRNFPALPTGKFTVQIRLKFQLFRFIHSSSCSRFQPASSDAIRRRA